MSERKYVIESKEVPVKKNEVAPIEYKTNKKTYTEEEVRELLKEVMKENKDNI